MGEAPEIVGIVMPLAHQNGGAESLLMHLLRSGSRRFQWKCLFLEEGPMVEQARAMRYLAQVCQTTHLTDPVNYLGTVSTIRRWIKNERLRIVFSWMPKAHMYVAPAAAMLPVKTMWYQHGISQRDKMDRITTALAADRVLCCSQAARASQDKLWPRRSTAVCYPGVPISPSTAIAKHSARERLGLEPGGRIVGMVARWERWKGAHIFVQAAALATAAHPDSRFFLVGGAHPLDPAYAGELRALVSSSGLGERFLLAGRRPAKEVPLWQAAADLIVHPVTGEEPFGMAIVEAMSMGKAVIASDAGGLREIIENGENGLLVPRGDVQALASRITALLEDEATLVRLGHAARERAQRFTVAIFAGRVDELVEETLLGPPRYL